MTLPDLHPDELLRRASQARVTPAERANLAAHLRRCPACALELSVRGDAATAGISSEADHAVAARVVERVLAATVPLKVPLVAGHWRGRLARAAIVALMLTSTAVGASAIAVRVHDRRAATAAREAQTTPPAVAAAPRAHRNRAPVPPASPPPTNPPVAPAPPVPTEAPATGRLSSEGPSSVRRARPAPRAIVGAAAETPPALQPPALAHTAASPDSAAPAVVLARAEEARAARRFGDALRLYEDLAGRFPGSREEIVGPRASWAASARRNARRARGASIGSNATSPASPPAPSPKKRASVARKRIRCADRATTSAPPGRSSSSGTRRRFTRAPPEHGSGRCARRDRPRHAARVRVDARARRWIRPGHARRVAFNVAADGVGRRALRAQLAPNSRPERPSHVTRWRPSTSNASSRRRPKRTPGAPLARAWLDGRDPRVAILFLIPRQTDRVLVRKVPLGAGFDAVALAEIAYIVERVVASLLAAEPIGVPPAEARAALAQTSVSAPAPSSVLAPAPPRTVPRVWRIMAARLLGVARTPAPGASAVLRVAAVARRRARRALRASGADARRRRPPILRRRDLAHRCPRQRWRRPSVPHRGTLGRLGDRPAGRRSRPGRRTRRARECRCAADADD